MEVVSTGHPSSAIESTDCSSNYSDPEPSKTAEALSGPDAWSSTQCYSEELPALLLAVRSGPEV